MCIDLDLFVSSKAVVDSLLIVAPIVLVGFVFGTCFVMQYLVFFLVLQSSCWGRESWLLYFIAFKCHVTVIVLCLFLTVPLVCLQFLTVAFPRHTYFTLDKIFSEYNCDCFLF